MSTHPKDCCEWEANNTEIQLEGTGLAEEFPFGCDTLSNVGNALVASRKYRKILERALQAACEEMPELLLEQFRNQSTPSGKPIDPDSRWTDPKHWIAQAEKELGGTNA